MSHGVFPSESTLQNTFMFGVVIFKRKTTQFTFDGSKMMAKVHGLRSTTLMQDEASSF